MKKQPSVKNRKAINLIYLALAVFLLSWILLWGNNSFYRVWKQSRKVDVLEKRTALLEAQNDSLARENYRLKSDPAAAETVAREQHGLIKSDEVIYRFKPALADSADAAKKKK